MAKETQWPKIKYLDKGPDIAAGGFDRLGFGWELHYFDFLHRWNGGAPNPDCFKVKNWSDELTVARVKYFHGIYDDCSDHRDLRHTVYHTWNELPRGALPIATVDIEEDDWDLCTLLTFTWTERCNKIYLLANLHDCGPHDPDDLSNLQLVANSLPQFLKQLKSYDHFFYRTWFQISIPPSELETVGKALIENGVEDWNDEFPEINISGCAKAYNSDPGFGIWLAHPNSKLDGVRSPAKISNECSILAIHVRVILKGIKLDRKLKKLGETPTK